jgi:hypothetical protein
VDSLELSAGSSPPRVRHRNRAGDSHLRGASPNGFPLFAPEQTFAVNGVSTQAAAGAPAQRLQNFAQWFNDNIEKVKEFAGYDAGGHGLGTKSNHASGTALDINWDDFTALQGHGADARTHFSAAQMQAISQELAKTGMTWGQYWTPGSRDPGHFELGGAGYDKGAQNIDPMTGQPQGPPIAPAAAPQPPPPPPGPLPGILGDLFGPPKPGSAAQNFPLGIHGFATGGLSPSDTVPAMLTPKEFVVKADAAQKNMAELEAMNAGQDPHKPTPGRVSPSPTGPGASSRGPLGSVTPPPPGPRIGQGQGPGFGISGGIIGMAESAAIMAAMGVAGMADGGIVPGDLGASAGTSIAALGGGGGGKSGAPSGGGGDPMTAVINRTVGLFGQYGGIAAQGIMSSLIPGASQKGGISDGGILSKLAGGIAGAHPSAPNTAGNTAVPLPPPGGSGPGQSAGGDTHIGTQAGVNIEHMHVASPDDGQKVANDLAFRSYAGYGSR